MRPDSLLRGCAAVVALVVATGCAPLVASFDLGGDEAGSFALAVSGGEARRAYAQLCPATRFGISFESFRDAVERNAFLLGATDVSIDKYESDGGLALVERGWLESSTGVTAATFYLSKVDRQWCLTGIDVGGTPVLPAPGSAAIGAATARDPAQVAAGLRNEAYHYYGLANPATRRYRMTPGGDESYVGTQRADLLEASPSAARFRIVRGGGLATLGSLEVALEADGIHLAGSSQGEVRESALILPATLAIGASWRSSYAIGPDGAATRYDGAEVVEGRDTVTTPAGTFDAIRVGSHAIVESGAARATVHTVVWYAVDVGSVRTESRTSIAGGSPTTVVVELIDRGDATAPAP